MNKPHQGRKLQNTTRMEKKSRAMAESHFVLLLLFCLPLSAAYAEDVVLVGKGAGRWPAGSLTNSVNIHNTDLAPSTTDGIVSITNNPNACMAASYTQTIDGDSAYRIDQGIWLVPKASVRAQFVRNDIDVTSLIGTIGSGGTKGTTSFDGLPHDANIPSGKEWCLALPSAVSPLRISSAQSSNISGEWEIITDGTQISGEYRLPEMYLATFTQSNHDSVSILPSLRVVRVNTLECNIVTQESINFGKVPLDVTLHAELSKLSYPFDVNCEQRAGTAGSLVSTNINVAFTAADLHSGNSTWLATSSPGAYITGQIDDDIPGSGDCGAMTGIPFNGTPLRVGTINSTEATKALPHQVTWRLCSGGADLRSGKISASANLNLTYN